MLMNLKKILSHLKRSKFKPIYLQFADNYFRKGDILSYGNGKCKVVRVYKNNWWKKLLGKLKFKVRINQVKVVIYET